MPVGWMDHNGKRIIYADHRGVKSEQAMLGLLDEVASRVAAAPGKTLVLSDFTDSAVSNGFMNRGKELGPEFDAKIDKSAMIGVTGLKELLLKGYLRLTGATNTRAFGSEAEALAWLTN